MRFYAGEGEMKFQNRRSISDFNSIGRIALSLFICLFFNQACSHKSPAKNEASELPPQPQAPMTLKLVGEDGREEVTHNCSHTETNTFVNGNLSRKIIEDMSFDVKVTTLKTDKSGHLHQVFETLSKKGPGDLHDLAYPDVDEKIETVLASNADVVKAGQYPKTSIFYLPQIPLPDHAVSPGDTWKTSRRWMSDEGGRPMVVSLEMKFLKFKPCGNHWCAEVSVTGEVEMVKKPSKALGEFKHLVSGRFLFDPIRGLLVWSEFASDEEMKGKVARAGVHSILRTELATPQGYRKGDHEEPSCPFENTVE